MGTRLLVQRSQACDQPVSCPYGIGVFTRRSELSFHCLLSKVVCFILSTLYIEHLSFDITLIYSYMLDLTSWAHIWCVSGFVLKTRCYSCPGCYTSRNSRPQEIPIRSFYPFTAHNLRNQETQVMRIVKIKGHATEICIESIVSCKTYIIECLQPGQEKDG